MDAQEGFVDRLPVSVLIPSEVNSSEVPDKIVSRGTVLQVEVKWPEELCYPEKLCAPFVLDVEQTEHTAQNPEIVALEKNLKALRKEVGKLRNEVLTSIAQIPLPFPVVSNKI